MVPSLALCKAVSILVHLVYKQRRSTPYDLVASKTSRSLFISDATLNVLWKVQLPDKDVRQWTVEGLPVGLSINSSDELIVVVSREGTLQLDIYRSSNVAKTRSISLPTDITLPSNAVQSSKGSFYILYGNKTSPRTICELAFDGKKIIRSLDFPSSLDDRFKAFCPRHLSIDEDDRVFVTHYRAGKVLLYNSQLTHFKEFSYEKHQIGLPQRIYYSQETQQLIVGHGRSPSSISIFKLYSWSTVVYKTWTILLQPYPLGS